MSAVISPEFHDTRNSGTKNGKLGADGRIIKYCVHGTRLVSPLPDDVEALKALVVSMGVELAVAKAKASATDALIAHLKLQIAKLGRGSAPVPNVPAACSTNLSCSSQNSKPPPARTISPPRRPQ